MIHPTELIPYARHEITPEDEAAVLSVLRSKWLTQGPKVEEFEAALAHKTGAKYAVCVCSGTAALDGLYHALCTDARMHMHCESIIVGIPDVTFTATASAAVWHDAVPLLLDVDPQTGLLPEATVLQSVHGNVVVRVSLGGQWPYQSSPNRYIADLAHGPLCLPSGAIAATLSFHPAKHVACGEGGAVILNNEWYADIIRQWRDHGRRAGEVEILGRNARMPEMAAALGLSQLMRIDAMVERRRQIASYYDSAFRNSDVQPVPHAEGSWRHLYQMHVANRDTVRDRLRTECVGSQIHYKPLHLHRYWNDGGRHGGPWPHAEQFYQTVLSIPMFPSLTDAEVEYVAATVKRVVEECGG